MTQEITYTGISSIPSDYDSPDGQLQLALNLIPEDGALRPIPQPVPVEGAPEIGAEESLFIHKNGNYTHYIKHSGNGLLYNGVSFHTIPAEETIRDIQSVGNMLIVSTDKNLHYILWRNDTYTFLGNSVPDIKLRFALKSELVAKDYNDKGITTRDYEQSTTWQVLGRTSYDTTESDTFYFDTSVTIQAETQYKFTQTYSTSHTRIAELKIWGTRDGESEPSVVKSVTERDFKSSGGTISMESKYNYTNIHFTVTQLNPEYKASGQLVMSKGLTSSETGRVIQYTEDNYNAVMAVMNTFVAEEATNKNKFIYPFFVRYAVRLYDNSYSRVSAPILMVPNSGYVPYVHFQSAETIDDLYLYAFVSELQYAISSGMSELWKDLIQSVEIFVSSPVYPYEQGKNFIPDENLFTFKTFNSANNGIANLSFGYSTVYIDGQMLDPNRYTKNNLTDYVVSNFDLGNPQNSSDVKLLQIAPREYKDIMKDITSSSSFYKVMEIPFSESGQTDFKTIEMEDGTLKTLETRKALEDDSVSNSMPIGGKLFSFNGRLHSYGGNLRLPDSASPFRQFNYTDETPDQDEPVVHLSDIIVYINTDDGEKIVHTTIPSDADSPLGETPWFFYPHSGAYKAEFVYTSTHNGTVTTMLLPLDLKRHDFLDGAYFLSDSLDRRIWLNLTQQFQGEDRPVLPEATPYVDKQSTVYVSETNNPLTFKAVSTVSFGSAQVHALATTAKPLSQGQFGQFPLYAFTTEGIWALEVSDTGTYTARQPVTRDIILPAADGTYNVTQMDSAVLFPTQRGIMMLQGSDTVCLTEPLTLLRQEPLFHIPKLPDVIHMAGLTPDLIDLPEFIRNARIIYDYAHQRIILYNPQEGHPTAYVLSLRSRQWGQIQYPLRATVNAYPQALAINADGQLVDFSQDGSSAPINTFLLTRPFKLSDPTALKTIDTLIQRGIFQKEDIQQILYGTTDFLRWSPVWSSNNHILQGFRGTPYKAFRLAVMATLSETHSLSGATVQFNPRMTNKPR